MIMVKVMYQKLFSILMSIVSLALYSMNWRLSRYLEKKWLKRSLEERHILYLFDIGIF